MMVVGQLIVTFFIIDIAIPKIKIIKKIYKPAYGLIIAVGNFGKQNNNHTS